MSSQWVNERDYKFLLHEVLKVGSEILGKAPFQDHDPDTVNAVVDAACKLAESVLAPAYPDEVHGKAVEPLLSDGKVIAPAAYHELWKQYAEGGWFSITETPDEGGQGFPECVGGVCREAFVAANTAFHMYPSLTRGASSIIRNFCSPELRALYFPKMLDGTFSGTMCLTEPGAGSDVGALKTSARPNPDGTYAITGTKCFISSGDHDLAKNIVHLVLARVEGDPPGTKGISIFLVPKIRVRPDGSLGEPNDVVTAGLEHKMGIHGNATCTLSFGDAGRCVGYLIGNRCEGMKIMFKMMNGARLGVGVGGVALASAAYLHAAAYAKDRRQGSDALAPSHGGGQVPITKHPDVRRMLLAQKSIVEGTRLLALYCYYAMDRRTTATGAEEKAKWQGFVDMLTPLIKAYCTEMGFEVNDLAVQTLGGYGYCRDYPVEQLLRDQRINSLFEGTNGIMALTLLGRNVPLENGQVFGGLLRETQAVIGRAKNIAALAEEAGIVGRAVQAVGGAAMELTKMFKTAPAVPFTNACDFLRCLGDALCGWAHLWMATTASEQLARSAPPGPATFYQGKIEGAKFFIQRVTALVPAKCQILTKDETSAMRIPDEALTG
jgi:alkylation response protein AidB-like acyl-CoA dehydrogenase